MRAVVLIVAIAAVVLMLVGCDTPSASTPPPITNSYPKSGVAIWRGDAQHSGVYDTEPLVKLNGTRWKVEYSNDRMPVVANGFLYYNSDHGVGALDTNTGKQAWEFVTSGYGLGHPAIVNKVIYFSSFNTTDSQSELYAVDTVTKKEKWRFTRPEGTSLDPAVTEKTVYLGINYDNDKGSTLFALDRETGKVLWQFQNENRLSDDPVTLEGLVFLADEKAKGVIEGEVTGGAATENPTDRYIHAVDAASGMEKWKFKRTPGSPFGSEWGPHTNRSLAAADGSVYFGDNALNIAEDQHLVSVNASSGVMQWRDEDYMISGSFPAIAGGLVYVSSGIGLSALDARTGQTKWTYSVEHGFTSTVLTSPVIAGEVVYFGAEIFLSQGAGPTSEGRLYALNAQTGVELWRSVLGRRGIFEPVVADGAVYVRRQEDGNLHALR